MSDNVVPIRPGIQPQSPAGIRPAGQAAGDVSPWSIIGWVIVGLIAWEGGKYVLSKAATPHRRSYRNPSRRRRHA